MDLSSIGRWALGVRRWVFPLFLCGFLPTSLLSETAPPSNDRHVVVIVCDGMRPDSVTTPTLWKLAREGVTFSTHHSIHPTATNVNGAAIATGAYPSRNSLLGNRELDAHRKFPSGEWRQALQISLVGETIYFDHGNGAFSPASAFPSPTP
jgi:Type I phosphodiesterase / nucleotide pyrophosphatase